MRFFIQTLGCKINQYESQSIREAWEARGWQETAHQAAADVVLVHTCAVTAGAVADSRGAVRRAGREAPGARVLVAGCAAQTESSEFENLPGVEEVILQARKPDLLCWPDPPGEEKCAEWPGFSISRFTRARPIVKIQDGCSHCCTYCIVPRARGPARSRRSQDIVDEVSRLLETGYREIILSGINLGQFRNDDGDFWDMLMRLESVLVPEWEGRARLRLSSLDPGMLGQKAHEVLVESRMVCHHLHLSMQSASKEVLAAMGRAHYGPAAVLDFLGALRKKWPVLALGADLLTGFPGESAEAFKDTLEFCNEARLSYAHVFPFSRRPGTLAAKSKKQLPKELRKERAARLRELTDDLERIFLEECAGLPRLVMAVERENPGTGLSEYYVECRLEGLSPAPPGGLVPVRPVKAEKDFLVVKPLGE
jgi:MiaB/RimO family radical SAM methylthiotransferase